jgi:hypothetical protein
MAGMDDFRAICCWLAGRGTSAGYFILAGNSTTDCFVSQHLARSNLLAHAPVSNTCTTDGSSGLVWANAAFDSPPRTITCLPNAAMEWPDLPVGAGPIF